MLLFVTITKSKTKDHFPAFKGLLKDNSFSGKCNFGGDAV